MDEATSENIHGGKENLSAAILNEFAVVAADFPEFNEENLHDFRKGIKKFRYLAELHSEDAGCQWIAAQVKKAQAAIGEWHDWQVLARTAREARHGRDVEIAEVLESLSGERFTDAVASCDGLRARLLDRAAGGQSLPKPPARNEQIDESIERLA